MCLVVERRKGKVSEDGIFELVVVLYSGEKAVLGQAFGEAEGGVAGESTEFENTLRLDHAAYHRQEPTLYVSGNHTGIKYVAVGIARDEAEDVALGGGVGLNVVGNIHIGI